MRSWISHSARTGAAALALAASLALAGCQEGGIDSLFPKAEAPLPQHLIKKMKAKGMTASAPIMIRIYKQEDVLEVWKATDTGRYDLLETYEICKWSGKLGPKFKEGDRQAPEGFYSVAPWQMNPNSEYHLSFNMGFPNTYDRAHGRTGTHLMVHGACSSAGCYSMTDERIQEIYTLAREAFEGGQKSFQIQAFPFRMTAENLAQHKDDPHFDFWKMLKEGSDHFEITKAPPKVDVCEKRYVFNRIPAEGEEFRASAECPETTMPDSLAVAYAEKVSRDEKRFDEVLKKMELAARWKTPARESEAEAAEQAAAAPQEAQSDQSAAAQTAAAAPNADQAANAQAAIVPQPSPLKPQPEAVPADAEPKKKGFFARLFGANG